MVRDTMPAQKKAEERRRITIQSRVTPKELEDIKLASAMDAKTCSRCTGGLYLAHIRGGQQEERTCKHCGGTGKLPHKYSSWARDKAVEAAGRVINPPPVKKAPKKKKARKRKR